MRLHEPARLAPLGGLDFSWIWSERAAPHEIGGYASHYCSVLASSDGLLALGMHLHYRLVLTVGIKM
jgi:hypothetical protein